jgi:glucokinase
MRYAAHGNFRSCEDVIAAANAGDSNARCAVRTLAKHLAMGCASIVNILDPDMLILGGGLAQNNRYLLEDLSEELANRVTVWPQRRLAVQVSTLGYSAGVLGAAAVASTASLERLASDGVASDPASEGILTKAR